MTPQGRGQLKQAIEPANQLRLAQNGKRGWQYDWLIWSVGTGAIASLKGAEPIVLISLLAHANYQGHSWPSVKRIAAETGSNARTVQRALSSLVEHGRGVIRRLEPGHDNRRTATYVFQPFDPSDAPSIVVDFTSLGVTPVSPRGDTSVTQTQVLNSEIELIVEKAGDDDEFFNSSNPNQSQPDQNPATGGLFDDSEASQALIEGFEWDPRDARSLVQRYGHAAVIDAVKTVEFYQNHKIPVGGKQVKSPRGLIVRHLKQGLPEDPRVAEATQKAQRAEAAKLAREDAQKVKDIKRASEEQDKAVMDMILANVDLEQIRQELVEQTQIQNPRMAQSYRCMQLGHPILQEAIARYVTTKQAAVNQPPQPSVSDE